jgi:hypothetical protein
MPDDDMTLTRQRRRRRTRRFLCVFAIFALLALATISIISIGMRGVAHRLEDGRDALQAGRAALAAGDTETALERFADAGASFRGASEESRRGIAGITSRLPVLGRSVAVARGLATAGSELAEAGDTLVSTVDELPRGIGDLAPRGGALPLRTIRGLSTGAGEAADHAAAALEAIEATPSGLLAGPVAEARLEAEVQARRTLDALTGSRQVLEGLPDFAGGDGSRRYFFVAESPAELRGTGGLWGAWAIATARGGRFTFTDFRPIQRLRTLDPADLPAPNPEFEDNYGQWGGAGFWRTMNMTPDLPSAGSAVLAAYEALTGETLDGVITADPFALADLLAVTGSARVPGVDRELTADNVVAFTTNRAYLRYRGDAPERKEILGAVAAGVFDRFLQMDEHGIGRLRAIGSAVSQGHLKIYVPDNPTLQQGLTTLDLDGGLRVEEGGDLLSVIVNSGSGTKIDYYATRRVDHDVQLGGDGEAVATTTVTIHNDAPVRGLPPYVIGPIRGGADAGENRSLITLSCAPGCSLASGSLGGRPTDLWGGSELGMPWFREFVSTPAGATSSLRIQTHTDDAWTGSVTSGSYRLTFLNQTTIQPTNVKIAIHAPSGQRITWTSEPMEVRGGDAFWTGTPGPRLTLEVRFSAPVPMRWWRGLTQLLP